ncbi:MAG: ATP/GTP-binding protein [Candidatus Bathyarchaeia archaeon]
MFLAFMVGSAGCGKSMLTSALAEYLLEKEQDVCTVNLDPGAVNLPYNPDVDIRAYISIEDVQEEYGLGPNGALIMASDLTANHIEDLREEIEDTGAEYVLVDTPGQLELFAFRASGPFIVRELSSDPKAIVYLVDAPFSANPLNFVSNLYLSVAAYMRILEPQIYVLSKVDLVDEDTKEKLLDWFEDFDMLEADVEGSIRDESLLIARSIVEGLKSLDIFSELIPVSAKTGEGLPLLSAALTRIFSGGEEMLEG